MLSIIPKIFASEYKERNMPTIVLVEDRIDFRRLAREFLNQKDELKVTGEAGCGMEALRVIEKLRPDIVITEFDLKDMNGLELTGYLKKSYPQMRIIFWSGYYGKQFVLKAWQAGAMAYVVKGSRLEGLWTAVQEVILGRRYFSPE
jgi:two-component system, NarL family, invasion response regulator UvrY